MTALLAFSISHGQVSVSADVSFSSESFSHEEAGATAFDKTLPRGSSFSFSPRVGYELRDGVTVGLQLGFSRSSYTYTDGFYDPVAERWTQSQVREVSDLCVSGGAFLRARVLTVGKFDIAVELLASYGRSFDEVTTTEYEAHTSWDVTMSDRYRGGRIDVSLTPVVSYAITKHLGVDAYVSLLSLQYNRECVKKIGDETVGGEVKSKTTTSHFGAGAKGLSAGLLTLGVSYSF